MKRRSQFMIVMFAAVTFISTVQANGMQRNGIQQNGVQASQYNPWRPQPQQWGGQHRQNYQAQSYGVMPQSLYPVPQSLIPARQFEYRRYIQQVNPYYSNPMPWWSDQSAVPYGPWSKGGPGSGSFW